jgi:DNA mismatch repair ATPase MutS
MDHDIDTSDISLLFPKEYASGEKSASLPSHALSRRNCEALETDVLFDLKRSDLSEFFTDDCEVLRYRQQTFADLEKHPEICETLRKMVPILSDISELRRLGSELSDQSEGSLYSVTEVELYLSLVNMLADELLGRESELESEALRAFSARVRELAESDYHKELNKKLEDLTSRVREIKSVTLGVNLDSRLRPESAAVVSVNNDPFRSPSTLDRIMRLDFRPDERTTIAKMIPFSKDRPDTEKNALTYAFNNALCEVFRSSIHRWKKAIQTYVLQNTDFLLRMTPEIEFITKATDLIIRLRKRGCPLCFPTLRPSAEKAYDVRGLINPVIALKVDGELVANDFRFDESAMIFVITGPNGGGKSVMTCAVGLSFVMAGLGLPVCAEGASISPCDGIYTHFPASSEDTVEKGRLGEECARLNEIFDRVGEYSLVLLDESLSSTGSFEGAYIAAEVLTAFSMIRCRAVFSTHLHDLAASVGKINDQCVPQGGSRIDNLVAEIAPDGKRSFRILRKMPDGKSYARDIAEKYGLSLESLINKAKTARKGE